MKTLFMTEGTERNQDRNRMEEFYYKAINDVLHEPIQHAQTTTMLKKLKAKLIGLNSKHHQKLLIDTEEQDRLQGENPSLCHIIKCRKRKHKRTIQQIRDENGTTHTTTRAIIRAVTVHFSTKFQPLQIYADSVRRALNCDLKETFNMMNTTPEEPLTMSELWNAITKGKPHKAPGHDGIGLEFYKGDWEIIKTELLQIMNNMYKDNKILESQLKGLIVCIPKKT